jgi:hypothetical protein
LPPPPPQAFKVKTTATAANRIVELRKAIPLPIATS